MDPGYARLYRELHERHWWWRAREALILERLRRLRPSAGFGAILDVGCGDGLWFERLLDFGDPEGLEPDAAVVSEERRRRWTYHLRPFTDDFDPGKQYGLILMLDVLEHLPDEGAALRLAARLLRPDGVLVLTVPAFRLLWTTHDDLNFHRTRYTRAELVRALRGAGFSLRSARYFFHWLFLAKLLVRARERLGGGEPQPPRIPPPPLNRLLYLACRLEQRTWGHFRLPFGSSILAVASPRRPLGGRQSGETESGGEAVWGGLRLLRHLRPHR